MIDRRAFLVSSTAGLVLSGMPGAALAVDGATAPRPRLDRAAYDRYIALMNAGDTRFADYYADDVRFIMNIRGRAEVLAFYARQRPYVREHINVTFFCADARGAAAEVTSQIRCIRACADTRVFGRALAAGEIQLIRGCLLYVLNAGGRIAEIKGPPPEIIQPWRRTG